MSWRFLNQLSHKMLYLIMFTLTHQFLKFYFYWILSTDTTYNPHLSSLVNIFKYLLAVDVKRTSILIMRSVKKYFIIRFFIKIIPQNPFVLQNPPAHRRCRIRGKLPYSKICKVKEASNLLSQHFFSAIVKDFRISV